MISLLIGSFLDFYLNKKQYDTQDDVNDENNTETKKKKVAFNTDIKYITT